VIIGIYVGAGVGAASGIDFGVAVCVNIGFVGDVGVLML
jgi:hypothetical protein